MAEERWKRTDKQRAKIEPFLPKLQKSKRGDEIAIPLIAVRAENHQ